MRDRIVGHLIWIALAVTAAACSDEARSNPAGGDRGAGSESRIRDTALHAVHAGADEPAVCESCHELLAERYLPAKSWQCKKCHPDEQLALHAAAQPGSEAQECYSCHDFTADAAGATACATCHADPVGTVAAIAPHDPAHPDESCGDCHRAHTKPSLAVTECESCHDSETVTGHTAPGIQIEGCGSCHGYHEAPAVASTRCTNCHRQSRAAVPVTATFDNGHDQCVTCHRPHRFFKNEVIGCRDECHSEVVAIAEDRVKEHRGCVGCHDNHDVKKSPADSCEGCHKLRPAHPKDRSTGTRCVGCHEPHAGRSAPLAVDCSSCHQKKARSDRGLHVGAGNRGPQCENCHQPHRFQLQDAGLALCDGCHVSRQFRGARHIDAHEKHSNCFGCHGDQVAHEPAGERAACASCHEDKAAAARKDHKTCQNCHDPHTTKQKRECGSCHEQVASVAHAKHSNCAGCHEPHTTEQKKSCAGCHAQQARSAPDKHRDCRQCHDKHTTRVTKQCSTCHTDRTSGIHAAVSSGAVADLDGCRSCHRPHGPNGRASPPSCTSCHSNQLPALHKSTGHDKCTECHRSHGSQPHRKAATCLSCHEDRRNHEPDATMCTGCHIFGDDT